MLVSGIEACMNPEDRALPPLPREPVAIYIPPTHQFHLYIYMLLAIWDSCMLWLEFDFGIGKSEASKNERLAQIAIF